MKQKPKQNTSEPKLDEAFSLPHSKFSLSAPPALVPKLRFPEFLETEGWKERAGDVLFDQISDRNPEPGLPVLAITQEHGAIPRHLIDYHVSVTEKSIESYKVVRVGDFIISLRSFQGGIEYSNYHGICSPAYVILRRRIEGSDDYFKHYLKTDRFIRILTKNLEGLRDGKMISYKQFSELLLPVPKPAEQQKITECLSSADELIAAQTRKVDALKTHKKGLLQKLFPPAKDSGSKSLEVRSEAKKIKNIEETSEKISESFSIQNSNFSIPPLRIPEFQNAGEWEEKVGGELFTNRKEKGEQGLPIYSVTVNDGMVPRASFERNFYDIEDPAGNRKVHKGDIAYNMMRMWQGAQGVAPEDCMVSPAYVVLKPSSSVCSDFFAYLFKLPQSLRLLTVTSRGLTKDRLRLYFDDFEKMPLCVPEIAEQERIATCLSSLDALITAETLKLDVLKTHKKGLMQCLFPAEKEIENLEGRIVK